jgi:hypothetical protein
MASTVSSANCQRAGIRAVVIRGNGDHFTTHGDLSAITDISGFSGLFGLRACHRVLDRVEYGEVPVVAVQHGAVVGWRPELAAAAHAGCRAPDLSPALVRGYRLGGTGRPPRTCSAFGISREMCLSIFSPGLANDRTNTMSNGIGNGLEPCFGPCALMLVKVGYGLPTSRVRDPNSTAAPKLDRKDRL